MKTPLCLLTLLAACSLSFADTYANGYTKSDGTYVQGHYRSDANDTDRDNWSTRGNTNPYTGAAGTRSPRDTDTVGNIYTGTNH